MERLKIAVFAFAQICWLAIRAVGRGFLGQERFDRFIDKTGIRGVKGRHWISERRLPDGNLVLFRPHDQCIVDEVYEKGVYACAGLRTGAVIVDVGAHIGTFSLMTARIAGPTGRVLSFEPSPRSFELLQRNLAANGLSWVKAFPFALADNEGTADLFVADDSENNPAADTLAPRADRKPVSVRLRRLDDVLAEEGVESIDLLKIDVEGAELLVMAGAPKALGKARRIMMEVHPPHVDPAAVRARLESLGFSLRVVHEASDSVILDATKSASAPH